MKFLIGVVLALTLALLVSLFRALPHTSVQRNAHTEALDRCIALGGAPVMHSNNGPAVADCRWPPTKCEEQP